MSRSRAVLQAVLSFLVEALLQRLLRGRDERRDAGVGDPPRDRGLDEPPRDPTSPTCRCQNNDRTPGQFCGECFGERR